VEVIGTPVRVGCGLAGGTELAREVDVSGNGPWIAYLKGTAAAVTYAGTMRGIGSFDVRYRGSP
jgi:hypothetical protein